MRLNHSSMDMAPLRILVVSSVIPEPSSGGQILLYRHLCEEPALEVSISAFPSSSTLRKRLTKTRLHRWVQSLEVLQSGRDWDKYGAQEIAHMQPDLLLTVAHGEGCWAAKRLARKYRLPLVTIFHDWWPDIPTLLPWASRTVEKAFRELYQASDIAFCVCQGIKRELGVHRCAPILFPIPARSSASAKEQIEADTDSSQLQPFRLLYFGNLYDYSAILQVALETLKSHPTVRLEVRGKDPAWSNDFRSEMRSRELWLDFAPRAELDNWLASADAFFVPMNFNLSVKRRMMTSFPSKLVEFAQFGKPIIIWGPEYCSAIQWAEEAKAALCITNPDPAALVLAIESLATSTTEQTKLSQRIKEIANTSFNPTIIQAQFLQALCSVKAKNQLIDSL